MRAQSYEKVHGIHYTPPVLADYLAKQVISRLSDRINRADSLEIFDPACGDGELLRAVSDAAPPSLREKLRLCGIDKDAAALERAEANLKHAGIGSVVLHCEDFMSTVAPDQSNAQLNFALESDPRRGLRLFGQFDAVISNPPYVRTQILGAEKARQLAARFDLNGRVDLYHAFVKAMTLVLREGGILGLLTSNRFLTVQAGASIRAWLSSQFRLLRLVDLGDTKLFTASVLPAILVARRDSRNQAETCEFIRVYEHTASSHPSITRFDSVLDALDGEFSGLVQVNESCYRVEVGELRTRGTGARPWSMTNKGVETWLTTVRAHTAATFGELGKVCVGIKTTADTVFIRDDWESLPKDIQPEEDLLYPLVTHHLATRWRPRPETVKVKKVLYPYREVDGKRTVVDLARYPRAYAYLLQNRERLERRGYVKESGREWFEIWVPHHPSDWNRPKLAFPDISESSKFFLVDNGWVINGDCYWIKLLPQKDPRWLWLMLAVANSSFALKFYDTVFHNKLYSRRRRFMTQYVSQFPVPSLDSAEELVRLIPTLLTAASNSDLDALQGLEESVDSLVWNTFGLEKEVSR
ncbi:MAG: N-6 DNA methylase [Deltaproteobacteria bacterium]|nr:N-6 DNA methylase [Deltaproteobacteria bacterium]